MKKSNGNIYKFNEGTYRKIRGGLIAQRQWMVHGEAPVIIRRFAPELGVAFRAVRNV